MYYEINVAKLNKSRAIAYPYVHFFATAERSITNRDHLKKVYNEIAKAFPSPEYEITVSKYETIGENIDMNDI